MLSSQRLWPRLWSNSVAFIFHLRRNLHRLMALEQSGQVIIHLIADVFYRQVRRRFELLVNSRSESKAGTDNISSVARQVQLPSGRPGTFIRASRPRLSRSCRGAIASAAIDDHAVRINSEDASPLSPCDGGRERQKF